MKRGSQLYASILVPFCFVTAICLSCRSGPEPRTLVRGTATDSITAEPIDSAQIVIGDTILQPRVVYSNSQGKYAVYPDTFGVLPIYCRKDNYSSKVISIDLTTGQDVYDNVDFELVPE